MKIETRKKIKKHVLETLTPKEAWALIHPLILAETHNSFHLKITSGRNGRKIIHAANGKVYVERDGSVLVASKYKSISSVNVVSVDATGNFISALGLKDLTYEERQHRVIEYIELKYHKGWRVQYTNRAQSNLMWNIMRLLPEENKRIAYASGGVFFSSIATGTWRLQLIAQHLQLLLKVYMDDRRLLSAVLEMLNQKHVFARPDTAIKETKDLLLSRGLSECGWRKFLKLSAVEKQGWVFSIIGGEDGSGTVNFDPQSILMLNLISSKKINVRIYNPRIITQHISSGFGYDFLTLEQENNLNENRMFILEIVLKEAEKVQKANNGKLSNQLLRKTINRTMELFDFINAKSHEQLNIPHGAGYSWLKRQSDIWHIEVATREIDGLTVTSDWSERIPNDLAEIKMQDNFIATMLTSTEAFYLESNKMHHCVSSRWETAYAGGCYVFHLHDTFSDAHATLDLRKNDYDKKYYVYECRSFCNDGITPELDIFSKFIANYLNTYNKTQKLAA